ncbi:PD-(D/E)XK nuclease-like domain-containing protein [Streptomyces sp. SAS_275]|uniref:PD-(D/E)XK nuclease-like domain-containing protein n=1 Tax=Streptomyces sp. SAS_275 TaxID=3412746 RepID=UPI00403C7643
MTAAVEVEAPQILDGLSAEDYHADKTSISSSGLRALLNPGCPAQFKYDRDHPQAPKKEFDLGHAAHLLVLGEGPELEVIDFPDWRKKDAQIQRGEAYLAGKIPLLAKDYDMVQAMAEQIRQHPHAGPLFTAAGFAERSIYWTDAATGVRCRVRPDWMIPAPELTWIVDYKTTTDANPDACSKAIESYSYHQQGALYIDGVQAAGLAPEGARFVFVFQSKKAPYLVTVRELADQDQDIGRARNERALGIYRDCEQTGIWPDWTGTVPTIPQLGMPTWATIRQFEEYIGE